MTNFRKERADQLQEMVSKLPRIGSRPIQNVHHLRETLYEVALDLATQREMMCQVGDPKWTTMADLLDDMMDVIDYVDAQAK